VPKPQRASPDSPVHPSRDKKNIIIKKKINFSQIIFDYEDGDRLKPR
jgi:hypothetical protein